MAKKNWLYLSIIIFIGFFYEATIVGHAATKDQYYTQVTSSGEAIDGNLDPVVIDKPIIRPAYVGSDPYEDYLGPEGKFKKGSNGNSLPQTVTGGNSDSSIMILQQMGFYQNRPIALLIQFQAWYLSSVAIRADGGTNLLSMPKGYALRLVYNDGQVKNKGVDVYTKNNIKYESIKDVVFELPTAFNATKVGPYGRTKFVVKQEGLIRVILNSDIDIDGRKAVIFDRKLYQFVTAGYLSAMQLEFNDLPSNLNFQYFVLIQDNNYPLLLASNQGSMDSSLSSDLFASYIPSFRELSYGPPKSTGTQNTDKLEANYHITQSVDIAYGQFYPDSLNIVMDDTKEKLFKKIDFNQVAFQDKNGTDISQYMEIVKVNDHRVEFKIPKDKLELLKNNQINIKLNTRALNGEELLNHYNKDKNVYEVPVEFYNYKVKDNQKTESEKMTALAQITPSIYGEPVLGIEAPQYTRSSDFDVNSLVTDVATTLPTDKLSVAFDDEDKDIYFDTVKTYNVKVVIQSLTSEKEKIITVPIKVTPAVPVTSDFFENQTWLIDEVNRQLAPKKIDGNPGDPPNTVFMSDLSKIKTIKLSSITGNQKIPATIDALNKLEQLSLTNSSGLKGMIPKEIGELSHLTKLDLVQTDLKGVVPTEFSQLTQLSELDLSDNEFIGKLPELTDKLKTLTVNDTQLTYNKESLPPFIQSGQATTSNSFVYNPLQSYLQLAGKTVKIYADELTKIRPFSTTDQSVFNLHAVLSEKGAPIDPNEPVKKLTDGHTYTILDGKTNEVYYSGEWNETISIPYYKGITYKVILDGAEKNPNNVTTIQTKIQKQKVTVSFVDETGETLHDPLTFEGIIGTTLDLTKEPQVQAVLKDLADKNYLVKQRPELEEAVKIKEKETNVHYQFEGSLFVYSHPKLLSFGRHMLLNGLRFIKVEKATFDEPLVIWDNRKKSNSWKVTATLETPLTSLTDPTQTLPEAIRYKKSETDSVTFIEGSSEVLATKISNGSNKYNVSDDWKSGKSGFQLEVATGKVVEPGGYRATILWQVGDTP
ncbi:leucine-rich repeat domain-containing protein [Enterococcus rotai]|uniref:leucine-rich repeat domain-containing protein n=1 Tax=Enterococcus rotai TaxID=118060 RepID=UPI0032B4F78C